MGKFTEADRNAMRAMRRKGEKLRRIAAIFSCSVPHVSAILSGRSCIGDREPETKVFRGPNVMPGITLAQLTAGRSR